MVFLLDWPAAFMYGTPRVSHNSAPALVYTAFPPKRRLSALAERLAYTAFPPKAPLFTTPGTGGFGDNSENPLIFAVLRQIEKQQTSVPDTQCT